ncbi:MAG: hypothetical protein ACYS7Y_25310 [Planctomycetota bacterium]|jgi:hypothetical protein
MPEPRLLKTPNNGFINVDVTLLRLGLSRCRCFAEDAICAIEREEEVDVLALCNSIVEEARAALADLKDYQESDEVGQLLLMEDEARIQNQ